MSSVQVSPAVTPGLLEDFEKQKQRTEEMRAEVTELRARQWLANPVGWVDYRLHEQMWSKERDICASVLTHRKTAVKSCHNVGKSYTASRLTTWWLDTHAPGTAFVVTTAPSFPQVRAILWREIGRAHRKGALDGRVNQTEWFLGDEMVAFGRKPADYDPNAFQGIHARFVLVIIDEAAGVPKDLWVAAGSLASNKHSRMLAIGNPDDPTSHFADVCKPGTAWNVLQISAFDSPNFTDEDVSEDLRESLVSQGYLDDLIDDGCGPGTAIWISKVEGEFPEDAEDGVVVGSALAKCRIPGGEYTDDQLLPVELGVDVGGSESGDATVIRERRGVKAGRVWRMRSSESEDVAEAVIAAIIETGATAVKIDSIGVGWGVAGHLRSAGRRGEHEARIVEVNVGRASQRPERYTSLRDELWWEVGRLNSEQHTWDLSAIDDRTAGDLLAPKWAPDGRGRIHVEKKDETKKRLGRSPDDGDALLLAYWLQDPWHPPRMRYRGIRV